MLARVIYGFRISVLFGLLLTILSSIVGVTAGAMQGYFGGRIDLVFQRFLEIWSSIPSLFVLIIISSVLVPGFWTLLGMLLLFHWVYLVGVVRAEFLRGRNFEYITAARALGPVQRQDHVQAPAAERDGGDADVPALQAVGLDHGADRARLPGARPAARLAVARRAAGRRARPICRRRGSASPRFFSIAGAAAACSSSSARACATRSTRARPSSEGSAWQPIAPLVDVRDLSVRVRRRRPTVATPSRACRFTIAKGETVALVGEFGLRQDRLGAVDPAAAALPVGVASRRARSSSTARTC